MECSPFLDAKCSAGVTSVSPHEFRREMLVLYPFSDEKTEAHTDSSDLSKVIIGNVRVPRIKNRQPGF